MIRLSILYCFLFMVEVTLPLVLIQPDHGRRQEVQNAHSSSGWLISLFLFLLDLSLVLLIGESLQSILIVGQHRGEIFFLDDDRFEFLSSVGLDRRSKHWQTFFLHQSYRPTDLAGTSRTTNPMRVGANILRQIVENHTIDIGDVNTTAATRDRLTFKKINKTSKTYASTSEQTRI